MRLDEVDSEQGLGQRGAGYPASRIGRLRGLPVLCDTEAQPILQELPDTRLPMG